MASMMYDRLVKGLRASKAHPNAFFMAEEAARVAVEVIGICGIICNCGAKGEPLACALKPAHDGPHAWASLPTFTSESQVV